MSAKRLPGKPLLKINGKSIIVHVLNKAKKCNIGKVIVATENKEIAMEVKKNKWHPLLKNSPLINGKTQSQSQKIFYHPNGVANCLWAKQLNKNCKSIYLKAIPVIISRRESFDIDTKEDFEFIKSIF